MERRWEPDARHAELVIALLGDGPRGAKVTTPLAKGAVENLKDTAEFLNEEEATQYRSVAMRAAYLAQDRPTSSDSVTSSRTSEANH